MEEDLGVIEDELRIMEDCLRGIEDRSNILEHVLKFFFKTPKTNWTYFSILRWVNDANFFDLNTV